MTARTASARNSGLASAVARLYAAGTSLIAVGARQPAPVLELLDDPGDRGGVLGEPAQTLVVGPVGRGDADPLADHDPQVDRDVPLGDVLVDLAVGEAGQRRILGGDQRLGLGHAVAQGVGERGLGQGERVAGSVVVHRSASPRRYHLPTPTWTSRKRAPGTA